MCGFPSRLKRMRSIALASVAVPTVERGLEPIRSWSTMIAVVSPSRTSTSGRASVGMKPCTKALYVSLIIRCDSAAIVSNTSELFARAGDAGEHCQPALRNFDVDVLEVVLAGALHADHLVVVGNVQRRRLRVCFLGHGHLVSVCSAEAVFAVSPGRKTQAVPPPRVARSSAHRFLHECADLLLIGCGQLLRA